MAVPKPAQLRSKSRQARSARRKEERRLEDPPAHKLAATREIAIQTQLRAARIHNCELAQQMLSSGKISKRIAGLTRRRYSKMGQKLRAAAIMRVEKVGGNLAGEMLWKKLSEETFLEKEIQTLPKGETYYESRLIVGRREGEEEIEEEEEYTGSEYDDDYYDSDGSTQVLKASSPSSS
ncbi:hypothetical protein MMC11_008331 [Xylographa trunciseda]|nr:hypothetical protein [Xylographa trunciseda]